MNTNDRSTKMNQLIAKAWADEAFKQRLMADPVAVLRAEGLELPDGLSVKVLENTEQLYHLVLPPKPTELSDDNLDRVSGGICLCTTNDPDNDPYHVRWADPKRH
ncbi:NHLP leader peptide family RiPP precursor [Rhodoferax sp.]|uniref:NHLP leader peptide family RiPP precursor n=1 Tax=Rhodoferax sp. TaxID=50421 RepID=UPI00261CE936|nr:NHLP leader peptide family RiPP precursor [Rhodoferax sp.]MDD2923574.1 NHLP leader peptide family RiPP precursor [Rhodoferax sp.]